MSMIKVRPGVYRDPVYAKQAREATIRSLLPTISRPRMTGKSLPRPPVISLLAPRYMHPEGARREAMAIADWLAAAKRGPGTLSAAQKATKERLEVRKAEHHVFWR